VTTVADHFAPDPAVEFDRLFWLIEGFLDADILLSEEGSALLKQIDQARRRHREGDAEAARRDTARLIQRIEALIASGRLDAPHGRAALDMIEANKRDCSEEDAMLTERVITAIAEANQIPTEEVTLDSTFEELGIDSLSGLTLLADVEDVFGISISDQEACRIRNVRQVVESVQRLLTQRAPGHAAARMS
jgi:acyl carrier protein